MSIDSITISHQVSRCGFVRKRFHDLLRRPIGCGILCHIEMQKTATVVRQYNEDIQYPKLDGRNREEIDRDHLADVIPKERHPRL
jgi:hypothetical protein